MSNTFKRLQDPIKIVLSPLALCLHERTKVKILNINQAMKS